METPFPYGPPRIQVGFYIYNFFANRKAFSNKYYCIKFAYDTLVHTRDQIMTQNKYQVSQWGELLPSTRQPDCQELGCTLLYSLQLIP